VQHMLWVTNRKSHFVRSLFQPSVFLSNASNRNTTVTLLPEFRLCCQLMLFCYCFVLFCRDVMLAWFMPSPCVRLCVSVTLRYCIKMAELRIMQIMPHDSTRTLVLWC